MSAKKLCCALLLLAGMNQVFAGDTPDSLVAGYVAEASATTPGFTVSGQRGKSFFLKEWGVSDKMPTCNACHGKNLKIEGKHVVTDKIIKPMDPSVNPERFSSSTKVEKWFKRNCKEVAGRECTPAEKADFIQFITHGG